jgi:RimJ/RimL family protein N-acetyltransferase
LEPLKSEHAEELAAAIAPDDDVFRWTSTAPRGIRPMHRWIQDRQTDRNFGRALPFVQRDALTGRLVGSTSLFDWLPEQKCAEIGHTWIVRQARRTGVNTEAKLLLLTHGFEEMGLARIQIVTDARNERSRNAIARIGGHFEGILRNHRRDQDGDLRDSPYFSFIDREWPQKKAALQAMLL